MKNICIGLKQYICFVEEYFSLQSPRSRVRPFKTYKMEFIAKTGKGFKLYTTSFASFIFNVYNAPNTSVLASTLLSTSITHRV